MRRIAKIVLAAALAAAAAQAVRWLLEREGNSTAALPRPKSASSGASQAGHQNGAAPSGAAAGGPTRDELYREARRLEIEGRSKMNKKELQEAVAAAKTGGST
jgi:hypothetical protein